MDNPLARRLSGSVDLNGDDRGVLDSWCAKPIATRAGADIVREGDDPIRFCIVLEGWAYRYKIVADGVRQIVGFMLPGDTCDLHGAVLDQADHGIAMLSAGKVALVPDQAIEKAAESRPAIMRALWWSALVDASVARAWLANIGRRPARERVAHLLCELWVRADQVGLTAGNRLRVPVTQNDLADALALTPVHVNRTLRQMQDDGSISYRGGEFTIPDLPRLEAEAGFNPAYLHLNRAEV